MNQQFNTEFDHDEWVEKKQQEKILDYFPVNLGECDNERDILPAN